VISPTLPGSRVYIPPSPERHRSAVTTEDEAMNEITCELPPTLDGAQPSDTANGPEVGRR
jgi:hypothetical protein